MAKAQWKTTTTPSCLSAAACSALLPGICRRRHGRLLALSQGLVLRSILRLFERQRQLLLCRPCHPAVYGRLVGDEVWVAPAALWNPTKATGPNGQRVKASRKLLLPCSFSAKLGFEPKWFFRAPASACRPHVTLYLGRRHMSDALSAVVSPDWYMYN